MNDIKNNYSELIDAYEQYFFDQINLSGDAVTDINEEFKSIWLAFQLTIGKKYVNDITTDVDVAKITNKFHQLLIDELIKSIKVEEDNENGESEDIF